jgi:glycosyltransferase involved in cell wall biosynthesis
MSHTCSIVIRAFNEEKHIARLLQGIKMQTVQDVEVTLVDSGSTDATAAIAAGHGAVVIHIPPEEFTFGRSLNLGVESASREFVVIASAHVYPVFAIGWNACSSRSRMQRSRLPTASNEATLPPSSLSGRSSPSGSRNIPTRARRTHSAIMPTRPFAAPFGKRIPMTRR